MYRIEVEGRVPTLNQYRNFHYYKNNNLKQEWTERLLRRMTSLPHFDKPITLHVTQFTKRMRDCDNTVIAAKYMQDALVKGGYIQDDNPDYIKALVLRWDKATKEEKIVYTICLSEEIT